MREIFIVGAQRLSKLKAAEGRPRSPSVQTGGRIVFSWRVLCFQPGAHASCVLILRAGLDIFVETARWAVSRTIFHRAGDLAGRLYIRRRFAAPGTLEARAPRLKSRLGLE